MDINSKTSKIVKSANRYFDKQFAKRIIGKYVIIGYTYRRTDGTVDRFEQKHGIVTRANEKEGVGVQLSNSNEVIWLPPDLRSWEHASPGTYRLRSTSEDIIDPDYLTKWVVDITN